MNKFSIFPYLCLVLCLTIWSCGNDPSPNTAVNDVVEKKLIASATTEPATPKTPPIVKPVKAGNEDLLEIDVDQMSKNANKEEEVATTDKKADLDNEKKEKEAAAKRKRDEERKKRKEREKQKAEAAKEYSTTSNSSAIKEKTRTSSNAKIQFDQKTLKYGMIMQGDKIDRQFKFRNTGTSDLLIENVTASCGCTQPSYPFIPIPPGETGVIGVNFNSTGKLGPQKPTITVTTNGSPRTVKLYLDGFVDAERAKDQVKKGNTEPINIIDEEDLDKQ